jgi:hypothetical protein
MDDVTVSFINCPDSVRHVLSMARNEMEIVREPDFAWFGKQAAMSYASGVYSCWSAGSMDGWVGHEGPMVRERLGPDRYIQLEGVPHAFCLNDKDFPPVVEVCASWLTVHSKTPTSTIAGDITPSTSASGSGMSSGVSSGSSSGIRNGIMSAILSGRRSSDSGSARHSTDSAGRRSSTDSRRSNRSGRLRRIFNPSS